MAGASSGVASVSRTAKDALQAKYSAAVHGGYGWNDTYDRLLRFAAEAVKATKRQTPLVNAGYAVRITCILDHIGRFVEYHAKLNHHRGKLQIVLLGAGLDVTGLYALLEFENMHVVEVDMPDVCKAKKEFVSTLEELKRIPEKDDSLYSSYTLTSTTEGQSSRYTLLAADLRHLNTLAKTCDFLDSNAPTLVLSELVLAYISERECNKLFEWCASNLCCSETSAFLAFEPLGPKSLYVPAVAKESSPSYECKSVLEEYKSAYYGSFLEKLDRGTATKSPQDGNSPPLVGFYPMAHSCSSVEERLHLHGFDRAFATSVGAAVAGFKLQTKEPFDEHAALALHLQSYAFVCSFASPGDRIFQRFLCPWTSGVHPRLVPSKVTDCQTNTYPIWITTIEVEDEGRVRNLFSQTYQQLAEKYPSIRKMVKAALGKDLALTATDEKSSAVRQGYLDTGGDFLVAIAQHRNERRVVGGIAIRSCTTKEQKARGLLGSRCGHCYFEIHRLFVDPSYRGQNIASALLDAAQDLSGKSSSFLATTPSLLEGANHFYPARGFVVNNETTMGDLCMRTFLRQGSGSQ